MQSFEHIIEQIRPDHSVSSSFFNAALAMSRAVGRIAILRDERVLGFGTGFLIAPDAIITCNHVLPSIEAAKYSRFELDFRELDSGVLSTPLAFALCPERLFITNNELDISIIAIRPEATENNRPYISLDAATRGHILVGEPVNMIHHGGGEPLRFTIRDSVVVDCFDTWIHYSSSGGPGSAGAPLFNDQWQLIGIHHASVPRRDDAGNILAVDGSTWQSASTTRMDIIAKEGIRLSSVLDWLSSTGIDSLGGWTLPSVSSSIETEPTKETRSPIDASIIPSDDDTVIRDSVFISYAHADQDHEKWKDRLVPFLRGIPSIGEFRVWDDTRIEAGDEWLSEIQYALQRTKVAVLMIGPHFLTSKFIKSRELPAIFAASEQEGLRIIPLITGYAPLKHTELGRLQAVNSPDSPLESLTRPEQNRLLLEVAEKVANAFTTDSDSGPNPAKPEPNRPERLSLPVDPER